MTFLERTSLTLSDIGSLIIVGSTPVGRPGILPISTPEGGIIYISTLMPRKEEPSSQGLGAEKNLLHV